MKITNGTGLHLGQENAFKHKVVARIKRGTRGMDACELANKCSQTIHATGTHSKEDGK
jgi:hypothetical protein